MYKGAYRFRQLLPSELELIRAAVLLGCRHLGRFAVLHAAKQVVEAHGGV